MPIASLSELFPNARIVKDEVSGAMADAANAFVDKEHPEAGELFLGPQSGLRVIEIQDATLSEFLNAVAKTSDIPMVAVEDRKSLESILVFPKTGNWIRAAVIQFDVFTVPEKQVYKALSQDIDLLVIGFFDEPLHSGDALYKQLFSAAEMGQAVVGIMSAGHPAVRLRHADFLESLEKH